MKKAPIVSAIERTVEGVRGLLPPAPSNLGYLVPTPLLWR
jgi:hypothetical protein